MKKALVVGLTTALVLTPAVPKLLVPTKPEIVLAKPAIITKKAPPIVQASSFHNFVPSGSGGSTPIIAATNTTTMFASGGNITINLPAGISAGNLLLMFITASDDVNVTPPSGWTELWDVTGTETGFSGHYKFATGSEGATLNMAVPNFLNYAVITARVTGMHASAAPEAGIVPAASGTATPDPPNLTPTWGAAANLWIAVATTDFNDAAVSSYPTNYTGNQVVTGTSDRIAMATRALNSSSENPGVFTWSGADEAMAQTVAIRPA